MKIIYDEIKPNEFKNYILKIDDNIDKKYNITFAEDSLFIVLIPFTGDPDLYVNTSYNGSPMPKKLEEF
jgi:hypothetical protein